MSSWKEYRCDVCHKLYLQSENETRCYTCELNSKMDSLYPEKVRRRVAERAVDESWERANHG